MTVPAPSGPVASTEDLRRAIHSTQVDDQGEPTSAAFRAENMSVDVAGLAPLMDTRRRFPTKRIAIFPCLAVLDLGATPQHNPTAENISHAIIPGRLNQGKARKLKAAVTSVIGSLEAGSDE